MRCTEVAGRPFPDGNFLGRDIGDRKRSRNLQINTSYEVNSGNQR
jgi:hypothetical protein